MTEVFEEIHSCISESLQYKSVPKRYVNQLVGYFSVNNSEFAKAIQNVFLQLCSSFHKEPHSERGLKVIFSTLAELKKKCSDDTPEILRVFSGFMKLLITGCESREKNSRFASVWLLDRILSLNPQEMNLPNSIYVKISELVPDLLRDKHSNIRYFASSIAKKCEFFHELLKYIQSEPVKDIRKHMVTLLNTEKKSCKAISKRLKDPEAEVRLIACKKLQETSDFTYIKEIFTIAVIDRNKEVREAAGTVLQNYIRTHGLMGAASFLEIKSQDQKKQLEMLKGFRYLCENCAGSEEICRTIEANIQKADQLTVEQLLLLRVCVETLKNSNENLLFTLLPDLACMNLELIHPNFPLFYTQTMLKIAMCIDLGEESLRASFLTILKNLCKNYPLSITTTKESQVITECYFKLSHEDFFPTCDQDVFNQILSNIRYLYKDHESEFCRIVIEIINEIRDPITSNKDMGEESQLIEKREILSSCINRLIEEEQALDNEIERLGEFRVNREVITRKNDLNQEIENKEKELQEINSEIVNILQRALIISCELLRFSKHGIMDAELTDIVQTLIYPSLKQEEKAIHVLAIECLGLFCINHSEACKEYLYIFKVILEKKTCGMLEFMALKSVLDFYMVFDFPDTQQSDFMVSGTNMLDVILNYLDSPNLYIKTMLIEGLCKLLLLERNKNPAVLAKLLILFFDSSSHDMIKQILHVFFTHYPLISEQNALILAQAFFLAACLISGNINKTHSGLDLSQINVNKIFSFVFMYLNPDYLKAHAKFEKTRNFHYYLFILLSKEIINHAEKAQGKVYPRMLIQLNFNSFSHKEAGVTYQILMQLSKIVTEKICKNAVNKVIENISKANERLDGRYEEEKENIQKEYEKNEILSEDFLKDYSKTRPSPKVHKLEDDPIEYSDAELKEEEDPEGVPQKKVKLV